MQCFSGSVVAVTGAGGSIGSELCRRIAAGGARRLVLISLTEAGLYNIERGLRAQVPGIELVPVLGSVEDGHLMSRVLRGVEIVIHAAAHKHVPICESNPCAAIRNNVNGTRQLLAWAEISGVQQFVLISTDKAVRPASIMGASKRLAEILVREHFGSMRRMVVRFGNVLDSAGSVLPLWREQIAAGGPVTLTDERCERYFMSIPDACFLVAAVLDAAVQHSGTYVFDMGAPRRLIDLARELIAESGRDIQLKLTGLRPGEKLTEELHHGGALELVAPRVHRVLDVTPPLALDQLDLLQRLARSGLADDARALLWRLIDPLAQTAKVPA